MTGSNDKCSQFAGIHGQRAFSADLGLVAGVVLIPCDSMSRHPGAHVKTAVGRRLGLNIPPHLSLCYRPGP